LVYAETSGSVAGDRTRPVSSRPSLPDGDWRDFGIRLTELAGRLAERGMRLAYHHHMGTVVETSAEIDLLMAATGGSVGLLLDTGHLALPVPTRPISHGGIERASAISTARMSGQVCWRALAPPI
jgi:inosose dehydratase